MTFTKPNNIRIVDMCIYIDNNAYTENADPNIIYEYLYHIVYSLAKKNNLFNNYSYYDDFALYCANKLYFRYTNKKQFEINEDGTPKLEKIKSVLNYIKTVLYPLKVDFEQSEYCQTISKETYAEETNYNFDNLISKTISGLHLSDFKFLMQDVGNTCKAFLSTIPYDKNSKEWINIYVSVMLTFLNYITLSNKTLDKLQNLHLHNNLNYEHIEQGYEKESIKQAVLYHLPDSMSTYITVLARELKNIVAKDLSDILHTKITYDSISIEHSVKQYWEDNNEVLNEN